MKKNICFPILLAFSFTSCHLYSPYERPVTEISDNLFRLPTTHTDTLSLAAISWKTLFTDTLLQQLIDTGIQHNADLNIARSKVEEAEAWLKSSKLYYLPTLGASAQGNLNKADNLPLSKSYNLALTSNWELDLFGKQRNDKRGAKVQLQQDVAMCQAVQTQLVATIANYYYSLLMLDKQAAITQQTVASWEESVQTVKGLMRAGKVNDLAVRQTEANQYAVEVAHLELQQKINEMENTLSVLIGSTPQQIQRGSLDAQLFPDTLTTGVPLQLLSHRPDIRQKEMEMAKTFYATQATRARFYPNVVLGGNAGWTNSALGSISNPGKWLLSAVGSVVQPLFNKGENRAHLKVAEARQQQSLIAFQQALLEAGKEVNDALMQWQAARERIRLNHQQVRALSSALKNSEKLMKYGKQNYLDVLTAKQQLLRAQQEAVNDQFNEIQGVIKLYHALGGGL